MSATPDTRKLVHLLGDDQPAPVIESEGREYPVEIRSLPPAKGVRIEQAVTEAVLAALRDETGDVLVFLPGIGEIRRVETNLQSQGARPRRSPSARRRTGAGRPGPRSHAVARGAASGRAQHRHRRVVAHRGRRARGGRRRPRPRAPLRSTVGHDPAHHRVDQPGVGRPAGRTSRAAPSRGCATGCGASSSRTPGSPTCRPRSPRSTSPASRSNWPPGRQHPSRCRSSTRRRRRHSRPPAHLLVELEALTPSGRHHRHRARRCSGCRSIPVSPG